MQTGHFKLGLSTGLLILAQSLVMPLACAGVLYGTAYVLDVNFSDAYVALAVIASLLSYIFLRPYLATELATFTGAWPIARRVVLVWIGVVSVMLLLAFATKYSIVFSRRVLFAWFIMTPPVAAGGLIFLRHRVRDAVVSHGVARSAVVAGVNAVSRRLAKSIQDRPELGLVFSGFFDDRSRDRLGPIDSDQLIGSLNELPSFVKQNGIDCIFFAIPLSDAERARQLLDELKDTTASLYFVPDVFVFDLIQSRVDDVNGVPVIALCESPFFGGRGVIKRASDIVLASLLLCMAFPVMVLIALAIKLTSHRSIIFKQRRYGLDGKEITVYKFRTMMVSEDGSNVTQASRNDARTTPLGRLLRRYSLDELPQLINVLQGRMSVVGPRPHAVAHNETYRRIIEGYMIRHIVTPGITGLAQINGCRGETSSVEDMQRRVQYDLDYVRHWSLLLDLKILVRTIAILFRDERAY